MVNSARIPDGARILVVEDEALIADEIQDRLQQLGCEVVGLADTATGAVEIAGSARPDLVLMDIRLKGQVDGIQAADKIYRQFDIPVVFLTAHSDQATLDRAMAAIPLH